MRMLAIRNKDLTLNMNDKKAAVKAAFLFVAYINYTDSWQFARMSMALLRLVLCYL